MLVSALVSTISIGRLPATRRIETRGRRMTPATKFSVECDIGTGPVYRAYRDARTDVRL